MKHINMEEFANGAFTEQINRELKKVTENIQDPNTDAKAKRRIVVSIELKPNDARNFTTISIHADSKLAPALGAVTALNMGKNLKTGEVEAVEIGSQLPGQMEFADMDEGKEADEGSQMIKTVDPSTGEVYETYPKNVVDLRKARQA